MPRITQITRQVRRSNRVSVFLDGAFAFGLEEEQIYQYRLHVGEELSNERLSEIEQGALFSSAKSVAQRYLSRSMRSEYEVRKRLKEKEYPDRVIEQTIGWLSEYRMLDDAEYARSYIRTRLALRPASRLRLSADLAKKGVSKSIVREALDELVSGEDDTATAEKLARSYITRNRKLDSAILQRRLAGYLQRRGYSASIVYRVLRSVTEFRGDEF